MRRKLSFTILSLFACAGLLFTACDFGFNGDSFQNKAGAYFEEMTSTAAINSYSISPSGLPTDKNGYVCMDCYSDGSITFTLRNPQHYTFTAGRNMQFSLAGAGIVDSDLVTIQQSANDTTKITVRYPEDFLKANPTGVNISPVITLMHPVSFASFGRYNSVKLSSNAVPPAAAGAIAMQTQTTPSKWVICFNLPTKGMIKACHSDITTVKINGQAFTASIAADGTVTFPGQDALKTEDNKPTNLAPNQITGVDFEENGQPCYFMTSDAADQNERLYTIDISDDAGLTSTVKMSTKGLRLSTPDGYAPEDTSHAHPYSTDGSQNVTNENDDGTGSMRLAAKAITDGTEQYPYDPSDATVIYEVYKDDACDDLLTFGKIKGIEGVITVPGGDSYIKAYVRKPLYADSKVIKWTSRVVRAALYVAPASDGGSDSNDGSRGAPLLTMSRAVELFKAAIANKDYGEGPSITANLEIRVKGDLTDQPKIDLSDIDPAGMTYEGTLRILGWEGTRAVASAAGSSENAIYVPFGKKAELSGIKLSGNSSANGVDLNGVSLEMSGSEITGFGNGLVVDGGTATLKDTKVSDSAIIGIVVNGGTLSCENCEISKNGLNPGAVSEHFGVKVEGGASASFKGGKITGNKGESGAGIYVSGTVALDGVEFSANTAASEGGAIYLDSTAKLSIKGNNQIFGNKANGKVQDVFISSGFLSAGETIDVTGSLAGSKIGVCASYPSGGEPKSGEPVVFTRNYKKKNSATKPGAIFKGQKGSDGALYNVADHNGDAAFALGGGGGGYDAADYSFVFAVKESSAASAENASVVYVGKPATLWLKMTASRSKDGGSAQDLYYNGSDKQLYTDSALTKPAVDDSYEGNKKLGLSVTLWYGSSKKATITPTWNASSKMFKLSVPAQSLEGDYSLKVEATYLELGHADSAAINISKRAENAAFYIRGLTAAGDYEVVVEGSVGPRTQLIDGVDDNLEKLAYQLRIVGGSGLDLGIKLDLSGTSNSSPAADYKNYPYFTRCGGLEEITLPDWWVEFDVGIFEDSHKLRKVTLGSNVVCIPVLAFAECESLTTVDIPATVTEIKAEAFVGCSALARINFAGTKEQWSKVKRPKQSDDPWHYGPEDESPDSGIVHCTDGWCGIDYSVDPDVTELDDEAPTSGTYLVSNVDGLKKIRDWTIGANGATKSTLEGVTFKLANDIDTQSEEITIGFYDDYSPSPFSGTFDGCGYTIKNTINSNNSSHQYKALFWYVKKGTIKNLTVDGVSNCNSLVGLIESGTIECCVSKTAITVGPSETWVQSGSRIGGIVAYADGSQDIVIRNCVNKGNITIQKGADIDAGGIVGTLWNTKVVVDRCINMGSVSSTVDVYGLGGIVGFASIYKAISNCKNLGNISCNVNEKHGVGGIVGKFNNGLDATDSTSMILNCCNMGVVISSSNYGAGLFGYMQAKPHLKNNCGSGSSYYGFVSYIDDGKYSGEYVLNNYCLYSSYSSGKLCEYSSVAPSSVTSFSQADTTVNALNSWITNNGASYSSIDFAPWVVKDGKPDLDLSDVENTLKEIFGE